MIFLLRVILKLQHNQGLSVYTFIVISKLTYITMLLSSSTRINLILLLLCLLFSVFYISLIPCQRLLQKRHGNREIGANGRVIVMVTIGWWLSLAFSFISRSSLHRALFVISQSCPIGTWMFYIRSSWRLQSLHNRLPGQNTWSNESAYYTLGMVLIHLFSIRWQFKTTSSAYATNTHTPPIACAITTVVTRDIHHIERMFFFESG